MPRVIELGAMCDLDAERHDGSQSFRVSEYLVLDTGEHVVLHGERGFTTAAFSDGRPIPVHAVETLESLTTSVLNVVLPDDDASGEAHPWDWLAELARTRGIVVTSEELRDVPYVVRMTPRVEAWLSDTAGHDRTS